MNWYRTLKAAVIHVASPMAPVSCPSCDQKMLVDVNQPVGSNSSTAYAVQGNGECYCRCPACRKYVHISWSGEVMNFTRPDRIYTASNEEVLDRTRFQKIPLVDATPVNDEEFADLAAIIQQGNPIESV